MNNDITTYRVAPSKQVDFDLAGPGNEFTTLEEACDAAMSLDDNMPLDQDEWCIFACHGRHAPINMTRGTTP